MSITAIFVGSFVAIAIIYDVFIIIKKGKEQSISAFMIRLAYKHPIIPFAMGVLMGHLFWAMNPNDVGMYDCEEKLLEIEE